MLLWSATDETPAASVSAQGPKPGTHLSCRGRLSVISQHGAMEPTKTCNVGRTTGSSSNKPAGMLIVVKYGAWLGPVEPHTRQRQRKLPGADSKCAIGSPPPGNHLLTSTCT